MKNLLYRLALSLLLTGGTFLKISNPAAEEGYNLKVRYFLTLQEVLGDGKTEFSEGEIREAFLESGEFDLSEVEGIAYFSNELEIRDIAPFEEEEDDGSFLERSGGAGGPGGGGIADRGAGGPGGIADKRETMPKYPARGSGGGGDRGEVRFVLLYPTEGDGRLWVIAVPTDDE